MAYTLRVLGCHSATPRLNAQPTSQHLTIRERNYLIDCSEGTQIELKRYGLRSQRINHIFISHLHGDHFFGLLGLISSYHLLDRGKELHIHAPEGLREILRVTFRNTNTWLSFPLTIHPLRFDSPELILDDEKLTVQSVPLRHSVPSCGFVFREKKHPRKLNVDAVKKWDIPVYAYNGIKNGADWETDEGMKIPNSQLTFDGEQDRSYAFCSDTAYSEQIISEIEGVDWLYHESTFLSSEQKFADKTKHSTAKDAAMIASKAGVKNLLLGHYSARYKSLDAFKVEAQEHFENVMLAKDGLELKVN